ncbi:hypothetical protein LguiA_034105 [Lonicera macranthoides]
MYIEELKVGEKELESGEEDKEKELKSGEEDKEKEKAKAEGVGGGIVELDAKRVLVGAGARALFYPTLLYNVVRNKIQAEFRWWDRIDEFILLGAVPFPSDVKRLRVLGVCGVITLNEPYETLVPTSLYQAHDIEHLVLPTRDYLFAPSLSDISQAVDFIHEKSSCGQTTYVHCKAGRGRSTTIVVCYLVQHRQMTPDAAYQYVKSIRPRVLLASAQWQAVQDYYYLVNAKKTCTSSYKTCNPSPMFKPLRFFTAAELFAFDDGSVVLVTKSDLDGYESNRESGGVSPRYGEILVYRVRVAGKAAMARLSCMWVRRGAAHKQISGENVRRAADHVGDVSVDIHVY